MNEAFYDSSFGTIQLKYKDEVLYNVSIIQNKNEKAIENKNMGQEQKKTKFTDKVISEIDEYLRGERKTFDLKYKLVGTDFQKKVWKVLEEIPYGEVYSYSEVAQKINNRKAVRAVGGACHRNPIWLIVPCHRVVGKSGSLTGYGGGLDMKKKLLEIEKKYKDVPVIFKK